MWKALVVTIAVAVTASAADGGLAVDLQAQVPGQARIAHAGGTLAVKPGDSLLVHWSVSNSSKGPAVADVTLHVSLNKNGASASDSAYESALVMDFDAGAKSSGDVLIQAPAAANYRLRVETVGAAKTLGRESSAELDVKVQ